MSRKQRLEVTEIASAILQVEREFLLRARANTNSIQLLALNQAAGSLKVPGSLLTTISLIFCKSDAVKVKCRLYASSTTDSLHKNRKLHDELDSISMS